MTVAWPLDNEPLPPPLINSIQKKPPTRAERAKITRFSIWTPLPEDQIPKPEEGEEAAAEQQEEDENAEKAPKLLLSIDLNIELMS